MAYIAESKAAESIANADKTAAEALKAEDLSPKITITGTEHVEPLPNGGAPYVSAEQAKIGESLAHTKNPMEFDPNKFDYLFGCAKNNKGHIDVNHNTSRKSQLPIVMKRLGITDDVNGYNILLDHFESVATTKGNVVSTFTKNGLKFENRESLIFGPSGRSAKLTTTFEVLPDGTRKFTTTIPREGKK